ncbi:MAG: SDR family NAD(P)-dependent oxidoreductase [Myxococcota bacterium]
MHHGSQGKTILITGGSAGIGLAVAQKFAELGNEVIVTGRNPAKLEAAKAASPSIATIQSDAHSYSVSLRQQLGNQGVEVIELMPPAVRTEMLGEVPAEGGFQIMTTDQLEKGSKALIPPSVLA